MRFNTVVTNSVLLRRTQLFNTTCVSDVGSFGVIVGSLLPYKPYVHCRILQDQRNSDLLRIHPLCFIKLTIKPKRFFYFRKSVKTVQFLFSFIIMIFKSFILSWVSFPRVLRFFSFTFRSYNSPSDIIKSLHSVFYSLCRLQFFVSRFQFSLGKPLSSPFQTTYGPKPPNVNVLVPTLE